jgi:GntR family transcriptional regulator, transcriptional repressor for pyruvate dehydrogenase complex
VTSKLESERVTRELLARVVGGSYPPGVRLPAETDLAVELGCGRSTVREALTRLSTMGVVASKRGSGAHVLDWRREGTPALLPLYIVQAASEGAAAPLLEELLGMRRLLAREAVRLAVRYADEPALRRVRAMFDASLGITDPVAHVVLELEVFRSLVIASAVWPAVWLANSFWGPMRDLHSLFAPVAGGPPPDYAEAMKALLDLVEARREKEATRHVDQYLDRVDQHLLSRLGPPEDRGARKSAPANSKAARRS